MENRLRSRSRPRILRLRSAAGARRQEEGRGDRPNPGPRFALSGVRIIRIFVQMSRKNNETTMIKPELIAFKDRIIKLVNDLAGGKPGRFAKKAGLHNSVIENVFDDKSLPSLESIVKICSHWNISADWLLFGKEPCHVLREFVSEYYEVRPLEALETLLLFNVLELIEDVAIKERQKLSIRQTARLASIVYEHCRLEREQPTRYLIEKYLLLAD